MSEDEVSEKKIEKTKREYVALSAEASTKINRWIEQVNAKKKIKISRKSFLSWYIENASENLSNKDLNAAIERFYKTSDYLRQLLREVKKAEADGGTGTDIEVVIRSKRQETKKNEEDENMGLAAEA